MSDPATITEVGAGVRGLAKGIEGMTPPITPEVGMGAGVAGNLAHQLKGMPPTKAITEVADLPDQSAQPGAVVNENKPEGEAEASQTGGAEEGVETKPEEGDTRAKEGTGETGKNAQRAELQQKYDSGAQMTADELKQLQEFNSQDPARRLNELQQKYDKGDPMTDEEFNEFAKLREERVSAAKAESTPEQQQEQLQQEIDRLGTELTRKLANGEYSVEGGDEQQLEEDLNEIRDKRLKEAAINNGFTKEQAEAAVRAANERKIGGSESRSRRMREIQEEIQELMSIEYQILTLPNTAKILRQQRDDLKAEARKKHEEAENANPGTQERVKKKAVEYQAYMAVANKNAQIAGVRYAAQRLEARRSDLEQAVRRKLGVSGGLGALIEWGVSKAKVVSTEIAIIAQEEASFDV